MTILTGPEIQQQVEAGDITIDPWEPDRIGPASVDLLLHEDLAVYRQFWDVHRLLASTSQGQRADLSDRLLRVYPLDMKRANEVKALTIPTNGLVLYPGILYLGRTVERIQTDRYVPQVTGRSSVGRLGVQVHVTAGFGDPGFDGTLTLEITVVHPTRIYAQKPVCQVYFTETIGAPQLYRGRYQGQVDPTASRFHLKEW